MLNALVIIFALYSFVSTEDQPFIKVSPSDVQVVVGQNVAIKYQYLHNDTSFNPIRLELASTLDVELDKRTIVLSPLHREVKVNVKAARVISQTFIDVKNCTVIVNGTEETKCPFSVSRIFVQLSIIHSQVVSVLILITGWIYFFAWSISFYPQIILNYQRKSVVGLNFDFLCLNVIGFACYTTYNIMLYFDKTIQDIYLEVHPRSLIPVLFNDVVFATHALLACIVTGVQCFIYERGSQRISYTCRGWSSFLVLFAFVSFFITLFDLISWLQFIVFLSYVKMAVTLSKYFPQAILNYKRKSTVGWSIGNILLDFSGGTMDIFQMILQASNTGNILFPGDRSRPNICLNYKTKANSDDWSIFYGNPVKFGLGLVSIIFDVFFIIQHYILYRESDVQTNYEHVGGGDTASSAEASISTTNQANLEGQ